MRRMAKEAVRKAIAVVGGVVSEKLVRLNCFCWGVVSEKLELKVSLRLA